MGVRGEGHEGTDLSCPGKPDSVVRHPGDQAKDGFAAQKGSLNGKEVFHTGTGEDSPDGSQRMSPFKAKSENE